MENKFNKLLIVLGIILLSMGIWVLTSAPYSDLNLYNVIMICVGGGFLCPFGAILIIQSFLHIKILNYIFKALTLPLMLFIYISYFYQLLFIVLGCIFVFLLLPTMCIDLFYTIGSISKDTKMALIYLSLVIGFSLFAYVGQSIISKLLDKLLNAKVGHNIILKAFQPYIMRVIAYILLICVYILVNFEAFMKVGIVNWGIWNDLKVIFKEVLLTFVSIDTLAQLIISRNKK
ncbi:hypothetical protein Q9B79_00170 [Bacillus sp. MHSD_36]|uniref:hypothetical protein n=1 Tax=unclassified Bacillus (in: firmicutes) TaxID=185979 RepID=UPI0027424612|nr:MULTISPECIES: hypothetical protein [unclassified Bacillus (in: firmicutes)]MDP7988246.1 hypothetical protein [Bacillus sp. MHSD_36]MDR4978477.1 hypothetical protein [Bacillus sp. MHSD_37]